MYSREHFPAAERARVRTEIEAQGFLADPLVSRLDLPVLGLNVAFAWPLPPAFRAEYERLRAALMALDPGVFVYPFEQTHVTLATLVNFRRFPAPTPGQEAAVLALVPDVAKALESTARLLPFTISVGAPVLVRPAAFLPILNPDGAVARLRQVMQTTLEGRGVAALEIPKAVHSTILRFRSVPADPAAFLAAFDRIAEGVRFGPAQVDEVLVTAETRPYMAGGAVVHRVRA